MKVAPAAAALRYCLVRFLLVRGCEIVVSAVERLSGLRPVGHIARARAQRRVSTLYVFERWIV